MQDSSNSSYPSTQALPPQPSGADQRAVPCGPGGCIVSNDQAKPVREAGAEGLESTDSPSRRPAPKGVAPDYDDSRRGTSPNPNFGPQTPEPPTQFQKFVQDTTGRSLQIYGRTLFLNTPADFLPATSVSPPADYVIGTGDQLKVRAWGTVSIDVLSTVDRNGQVYVPQIGTMTVAGLHLDQAQDAIRAAIRAQYNSFELSVTLGQLRSIQVFVLGEARRPGVYTISSLSTLVNALFTSGGPTATGSLRDIQVKRDGRVITHFDAYDLLLEGDKTKDVALRPGDIILIPPVGPQVAVEGEVKRPAIYELRGPTSAQELIDIAGGLTPLASRDRATLDRIDGTGRRSVQDFPLGGAENLIPVRSGDVVRILPISSRIDRAVTLLGSVSVPGQYPWHERMRITDLIPNREFLVTRNYFNKQNALNPPPPDRPFAVSGANQGTQNGPLSAINADTAAAASSNPTVLDSEASHDLVSRENEINWNYAVIERQSRDDLTTQVIPFALGEAIDSPASSDNKLLEAGDVVRIYSSEDINLPVELRAQFVRIDGEVNRPGVYRITPNETLRDLVARAGGVSPHGYLYASQLFRESVRIAEETELQALVKQESERTLSPVNQTVTPDGKSDVGDLELRKAYIAALGQIHANGRVNLAISPNTTAGDLPDLPLQDRDHYFIPRLPSTINVIGNVYNQGAMRFVAGERVSHYLRAAGGNTREGDKAREFILRADGTVLSRDQTGRFDSLLIYPGDTIVVPARLKSRFDLANLLNYAQLTSSFALSAIALRALN